MKDLIIKESLVNILKLNEIINEPKVEFQGLGRQFIILSIEEETIFTEDGRFMGHGNGTFDEKMEAHEITLDLLSLIKDNKNKTRVIFDEFKTPKKVIPRFIIEDHLKDSFRVYSISQPFSSDVVIVEILDFGILYQTLVKED